MLERSLLPYKQTLMFSQLLRFKNDNLLMSLSFKQFSGMNCYRLASAVAQLWYLGFYLLCFYYIN
jgi:hypothetical protein